MRIHNKARADVNLQTQKIKLLGRAFIYQIIISELISMQIKQTTMHNNYVECGYG